MPIIKNTIIDWLNSPVNIYMLFGIVAVWVAFWHLLLKKLLKRCKVTTLWYELYELGAFGTLAILVFLLLIVALFIASTQANTIYGIRMIFPLVVFWGIMIAFFVFLVKFLRK